MSGPLPVLLLHGALRGRAGLLPTARFLKSQGFDARAFGYATRRDDLETHGARVEAFVDEWLGSRGRLPTLGILTHSMGALVARAYLSREGAARHAHRQRLVMLAPPNQGSSLAVRHQDRAWFRWLYGEASKELHPERVRALAIPPATCDSLILVGGRGDPRGYNPMLEGDDDGVVATAETPLPGTPVRYVGGVHGTLQWRRDVLEPAAAFLSGASPAQIGAEGQT